MQTTYDIFSDLVRDDPYPLYRQMRDEAPVHFDGHAWNLTRHADVLTAFTDPRFSSDRFGTPDWFEPDYALQIKPLYDITNLFILFMDPPDHTRLRGLVAQAFSAKMVESVRPKIQAAVDELLDRVAPTGQMDITADLANPLPGIVIAEMLGVPKEDQPRFKEWANAYARFLGTLGDNPELRDDANQAVIELSDYIREVAGQRRVEPRDDLITALVQAEEQGERLTHDELVATCFLLLFAGNETTTNLIGNGVLTLLRHPVALRQLREQPAMIRTAIEEFLRWESPVQFTDRAVIEDITIDGQRIEAGQYVRTILGAANRDPAQFDNPESLDLSRRPNRHIAFAHGIHFCLGAPLARAEGQIAINTLVQRFPALAPASDRVEWQRNHVFRALKSLPVTLQ
ncbi:MAG TPA: cytochrome P450 [Thermomicrobiales bacterium]|nr:cytochrome P450 [Thermomicrobiales bacterium]